MSQGVNRTANLPPALQADVAKMRNSGVPEAKINEYITNRLQYFATVPPAPAPALNAAASSSTAPAPALSVVDDGDANSNIDGTPINDSAFVKTGADTAQAVMQNIQAALATGANAKPISKRQSLTPDELTIPQMNNTPLTTIAAQTSTMPLPKSKPQRPNNPNASNTDDAFFNQQEVPKPVLSSNPPPSSAGILSNPVGAVASALNQQGRRNSTQLAVERPDLGIDTNEMLMRVGGRGLANAAQGGLAAYGAMFDEYGNVQDQRRNNALAEYQEDYKAQKDEQDRLDGLEAAKLDAQGKSAKGNSEIQEQIDQFDQTLAKFDEGLGYVQEDGITGPWDGFVGALLDRVRGDPKAAKRLLLQELKVDDVLIRIAQTKGAISDREMKIFAEPAPKVDLDDESTWRTWIERKRDAMRSVRNKLAGRIGADAQQGPASPTQSGSTIPSVGQSTSIGGVTVTRIQ